MKCNVIAEIGANHHGEYKKAVELLIAAKKAGADAVKVQVFEPKQMAYPGGEKIKSGQWKGMTLYDLYKKAAMPKYWLPDLMDMAKVIGIPLFPTVFHPDSIAFTEACEVPCYKIASFEIQDTALIEKVAQTGKPIILSTGKASYNDIKKAVYTVRRHHNNIVLLHCVSKYPASTGDMNLMTIPAMKHSFKTMTGLSDHTDGILIAPLAAGLGADMVEKHITLDKEGLDGDFSITPDEFTTMVNLIRESEEAVGDIHYKHPKQEYCRHLVAIKKIKAGEAIKGKVELLRTITVGTRNESLIADRDYAKGDLIEEKKNVQGQGSTNNRRNRKPRTRLSRKARRRAEKSNRAKSRRVQATSDGGRVQV